jgi:hypothetical protein
MLLLVGWLCLLLLLLHGPPIVAHSRSRCPLLLLLWLLESVH